MQLTLYHVECLTVVVFDRHVFKLALDRVETQTMSDRDVETLAFLGNVLAVFSLVSMVEHLHEHIAVGNEADDYTDVFGQ